MIKLKKYKLRKYPHATKSTFLVFEGMNPVKYLILKQKDCEDIKINLTPTIEFKLLSEGEWENEIKSLPVHELVIAE